MLLVTTMNILTGPNALTVLLEYINFNHNGIVNQIYIREELPILDLTLPLYKPM